MLRRTAAALVVLVLSTLVLNAADPKAKKPTGKWVREVGDAKVSFDIHKEKLHFSMNVEGQSMKVDATYEVDKENVIKGKITKIEKKGLEGGPNEGDTFSFKFKVEDGTLTVSEVRGADGQEIQGQAKELIEGDYKLEKKKEKKDK